MVRLSPLAFTRPRCRAAFDGTGVLQHISRASLFSADGAASNSFFDQEALIRAAKDELRRAQPIPE